MESDQDSEHSLSDILFPSISPWHCHIQQCLYILAFMPFLLSNTEAEQKLVPMEMGKIGTIVLLSIVFFVSCRVHNAEAKTSYHLEIEKMLKHLNKPSVKSIQSEDGDIVDCVDIYKQPAFDHPALKDHVIQMRPSFEMGSASSEKILPQTWQRSGSCPHGTVPIRRIRKEDLLRASSLGVFGKKDSPFKPSTRNISSSSTPTNLYENISVAVLHATGNFIGAQGDVNIWNPKVDLPDDYTTAQVSVKGGHEHESLDAGWMVNPKLYGDNQTRFFVRWTLDGYKNTGCFDLFCDGFVQTNPDVGLGLAIRPVSSKGGPQYIMNIGITQDTSTGNWWLRVRNDVGVGYWPVLILNNLKRSATAAQWGGLVFSKNLKGSRPHTATAMGSGEFSNGGRGNACYIKRILIKDAGTFQIKYPDPVDIFVDEQSCYTAKTKMEGSDPVFYFGGPGRNANCN